MLKITPTQMGGMEATARAGFVARLAAFLREEVPSLAALPREELDPEVERQIGKAVGYGLESERAASTYVLTAAWLGSDFDKEYAPAAAVLAANDMSEQQKADWLEGWSLEMFKRLEHR